MTRFEIMAAATNGSTPQKPSTGIDSSSEMKKNKRLEVNVPVISILGGPGSGKGTQCEKLVKKYNFTHISTGDLMRDEVRRNTEVGKLAAKCMKAGCLVDGNVVMEVLRAKFEKEVPSSPGFILDGYPRSLEQAEAFERSICPITAYVYLEVSDEVMFERLVKRGMKSGRVDDNEETAKNRIAIFHEQTKAIATEYSQKLISVYAEGSIEEVSESVDVAFGLILPNGSRNVV